MDNPIPHNDFFASPQNFAELRSYLQHSFGETQKGTAMMAAALTANACHAVVQRVLDRIDTTDAEYWERQFDEKCQEVEDLEAELSDLRLNAALDGPHTEAPDEEDGNMAVHPDYQASLDVFMNKLDCLVSEAIAGGRDVPRGQVWPEDRHAAVQSRIEEMRNIFASHLNMLASERG